MPQKLNLSNLSTAELEKLLKSVEQAILAAKKVARQTALEDVQRTAKKHGFSLGELLDGRTTRRESKQPLPPKYRNPKDPSDTWSGRGRQPEWFKSALESGTAREKMEV